MRLKFIAIMLLMLHCASGALSQSSEFRWPAATREHKPWTRWWWHGSAVTKEGISAELAAYKKAGLGGVEITPIYGVYGSEKNFVNYLSKEWMDLLLHTLNEAERLDMGVDMATGTGWPFGGPWVGEGDACKNVEHKIYRLKSGERLKENVVYIQEPFVRAVGSQVYEVLDTTIAKEPTTTSKQPLASDKDAVDIMDIADPVESNKNLQALALDQVKFSKRLPLQTLMAYSDHGKILELTAFVNHDGVLDWVAPAGNWVLYAVFMGWHGKMVERAGPGGEGNVIDHFSADALTRYLGHFDKAFGKSAITGLRGFFNDSYEVDDARGNADWTPLLFDEFKRRRGYDLKFRLPALFESGEQVENQRVLCDYRETISELVLENFTRRWKAWAHQHDAVVRNQAHGSPSNILDLYATVDIPEIEGVEPLRIKMATSAGHVTGKKLISSESATWLNEHFESNLADIKGAVDRFLLAGVNHIFYHGTTYSPADDPWPGWLFYAAVHLNPRNSLWPHFPALNKYVERSQSILQSTKPDNDVLLYYPIYDRFSTPGDELIEHFDAIGAQFDGTAFKRAAELMLADGYAYDYISDKQLQKIRIEKAALVTEGNTLYRTVVLPKCKYIPLATLQRIISLAEEGATIIFYDGMPSNKSGSHNVAASEKTFRDLLAPLKTKHLGESDEVSIGRGKILIGTNLPLLLKSAHVRRETMVGNGIGFLRKKNKNEGATYFIGNGEKRFEGWITLQTGGNVGTLYDPMTGEAGVGRSRTSSEQAIEVWVELEPQQTVFIEVQYASSVKRGYPYEDNMGTPLDLTGNWQIICTDGGPELPPPHSVQSLSSWTTFPHARYQAFSGTAVYKVNFQRPDVGSEKWILDLGQVNESAEVILNGKSLGILLGPVFRLRFEDSLLKAENQLEVKVVNLMANRIAYLDRTKVFWKKFYNVNFPARKAENRVNGIFDASRWPPKPSGLFGPVQLIPLR